MEITRRNFSEELPNIVKDLNRSCFVGFDAEFTAILTGDSFKHRLFDTNVERYNRLKTEVSKMIMTQVGLTMFHYERDRDSYTATGYTFHLCPQVFSDVNQSFIFQASTLKFLCRHNFDFNKFIYEGLPYLSKAEEVKVRESIKKKSLFQNLTRSLDMEEERQLQRYCSEVSKWLSTSDKTEETMYLEVEDPVMRFITHNELRIRFTEILTTDSLGNSKKILIYKDKYVEGANSAPMGILEDNLMDHLLGFSQIMALLETHKKPIIGHNMFLDTVLMHNQFIGPLPDDYDKFKRNINTMFPVIFDTKYISHSMGKKLTYDEVWKSNVLQDLYEFFAEGKCKKLQHGINQIRLRRPFNVKQSYHEAGWDSYCSAYCFIRLGHWAACENIGTYRAVGPAEVIAALRPYCNKINVIRGAIPYMSFSEDDPPSHRPDWLRVTALRDRVIDVAKTPKLYRSGNKDAGNEFHSFAVRIKNVGAKRFKRSGDINNDTLMGEATGIRNSVYSLVRKPMDQVASLVAAYGNVDIKPHGTRSALIAANAKNTADRIVKSFKDSKEFKISYYKKQSLSGRVVKWGGALITGSLVLLLVHKKLRVIS